jgi:hypothetical protein
MKKIILPFLFIFSSLLSSAQVWSGMGSGANYWVNALTVYNSNVIAGGRFTDIGNYIAQWNGTTWSDLGSGIKYAQNYGIETCINSLLAYNGNLLGGGSFDTAGITAASCIAQWNGTIWDSIGTGTPVFPYATSSGKGVNTIISFDSIVYACGYFDSIGHRLANNIAQWNGTKWLPLGSGTNGSVSAMAIYNNHLFIGGTFDSVGGKPAGIAEWNGSGWISICGPLYIYNTISLYCTIQAMAVYNGKLYVGGQFDSIGGIAANNIACWDGTTWSSLGKGVAFVNTIGFMGGVAALTVYNGNLIVGGGFDSAGGMPDNLIAKWDGSTWSKLGNGISPFINNAEQTVWVSALCVNNGSLFAGGSFDTAGGIYTPNIARWTEPVGIDEIQSNSDLVRVYPNPSSGIMSFELGIRNESTTICIYNVLGEKVQSLIVHNSSFIVDLRAQPAGIYLYRITSEKGEFIGSGKLVIQ